LDTQRDFPDSPQATVGRPLGPVRGIALAGALLAGLGVALGAFGAHGLRTILDARALGWWQTAVEYQMWHALGLLAVAGLRVGRRGLPALLLGTGTILFSGSLYLMALTGLRWLGAVTPLGGLLLIAGWALLAWRLASPADEHR
jgi:uncharacterized membrane protein YgdD (TMEM256/DUF423 family)